MYLTVYHDCFTVDLLGEALWARVGDPLETEGRAGIDVLRGDLPVIWLGDLPRAAPLGDLLVRVLLGDRLRVVLLGDLLGVRLGDRPRDIDRERDSLGVIEDDRLVRLRTPRARSRTQLPILAALLAIMANILVVSLLKDLRRNGSRRRVGSSLRASRWEDHQRFCRRKAFKMSLHSWVSNNEIGINYNQDNQDNQRTN